MGFYCDGCGRGQRRKNPPDVSPYDLKVHRRPNGDQYWLCISCQPRAYGSVPVDVAAQVALDREVHAGGPRVLSEPAVAAPWQPAGSPA